MDCIPGGEEQPFCKVRGTFVGGTPYMEKTEQWPLCHHGIEMDFVLQVDHADALHTTPFSGIYTVFKCVAPLVPGWQIIGQAGFANLVSGIIQTLILIFLCQSK